MELYVSLLSEATVLLKNKFRGLLFLAASRNVVRNNMEITAWGMMSFDPNRHFFRPVYEILH